MCDVDDAVYIGLICVLWAAVLVFGCRRQRPVVIEVPRFPMNQMPSILETDSEGDASSPLSASHTFTNTAQSPQLNHVRSSSSLPGTEEL